MKTTVRCPVHDTPLRLLDRDEVGDGVARAYTVCPDCGRSDQWTVTVTVRRSRHHERKPA